MARSRTPPAKAKAEAADLKNPGRHKNRAQPKGLPELGDPPKWMGQFAARAFELFKAELPWLKESDRVLVEIAATFRGRMLDPDDFLPFQGTQELRRCLGAMGATPADQSRVNIGSGDEEDEDDALFNGPPAGGAGPPAPKPKTH